MIKLEATEDYLAWQENLSIQHRILVDARLERLKTTGTLGHFRHIQGSLIELKWKQGIRVYLARTGVHEYTLLLGGSKHGQNRDIKKAKAYLDL